MKLFWKLFLSIMTVMTVFGQVEGYVLIQNSFQSFLDRETHGLITECGSVAGLLEADLGQIKDSYGLEKVSKDILPELITRVAENINIQTASGKLDFQIFDESNKKIYGSGGEDRLFDFAKILSGDTVGYRITKSKDTYKLCGIAGFHAGETVLYAAVQSDITYIYEIRKQQMDTFSVWMGGLLAIGTVIIFLISYYLSNPLRKLTGAAKAFAGGENFVPINVNSQDEVGILAKEFNRMAKQIMKNMNELKEEAERKEQFIGNFAHELKTPLTSMIGYADMMRSKKMSEEEIILFTNQIVREGKRLEGMSMKLMELFVLKKQDFQMKIVSSKSFLHEVDNTLRPVFEKSKITFTVITEPAKICVEPDLMKTVILNLLDNSRKAVAHDGSGSVFLKGKLNGGQYEITVLDNGCGIPENEIRKIQEPFYMVDKARSRKNGGAGLGLAICTEIIRIHKGTFRIDSKPEVGTRITIGIKGELL